MSADQPPILYPFRKRDPLTGKWYRARWKASLADIEREGGIVDGEPEVRRPLGPMAGFHPYRDMPPRRVEPLQMHPHRADPPAIDQLECFLACMFLRRYATYCVRRKRYAQAQGAASLWRELSLP